MQRHRQTRQDDEEFLAQAALLAIRSDIVSYPMSDAPRAPSDLPMRAAVAPPCCTQPGGSERRTSIR